MPQKVPSQKIKTFSISEAERIIEEHFGINGHVKKLPGGCDFNFHVIGENKKQFLLKISQANEEKSIIEMQNSALQWLNSSNRPFKVPELNKTTQGEFIVLLDSDGEQCHFARLFTYIEGRLLADEPNNSLNLLEDFGEKLGQLSLALEQFDHPAATRVFKWDLLQANSIGEHIHAIENEEDRQRLTKIYNHFIATVQPKLCNLRTSIIHNDANPWNVVVTTPMFGKPRVSGFIDFGDMVKSATICELAIAVTYGILQKLSPLKAATIIVKNYHAVYPLQQDEIEIIFDLILIRLCVTVVNAALRKDHHCNDDALAVSEAPAWELLRKLSRANPNIVANEFKQACQSGSKVMDEPEEIQGQPIGLSKL